MVETIGSALGASVGGLITVLVLVSFALYFFLPLIAFLAMRHLRGIRHELQRLNDAREHHGPSSGAGVLKL